MESDFDYALSRFIDAVRRYNDARTQYEERRPTPDHVAMSTRYMEDLAGYKQRYTDTAQELRYAAAAFARIAERAP